MSTIHALSKALQGMGSLHYAKGGHEALRLARTEPIDLILLDAEMPLMSGFQVCEALKADPERAHIPVISVTSHAEQDIEQAGLALGAADFIGKPIRPVIVAARAATQIRLKRAADELRELAQSDSLKSLFNRRAFDDALAREWGRSHRRSEPLSVMLVDVDHFKANNAYHGRRRGDDCLVSLTQALTGSVKRPADLVARYGGVSFAGASSACAARAFRAYVQRLPLPHTGASDLRACLSVAAAGRRRALGLHRRNGSRRTAHRKCKRATA